MNERLNRFREVKFLGVHSFVIQGTNFPCQFVVFNALVWTKILWALARRAVSGCLQVSQLDHICSCKDAFFHAKQSVQYISVYRRLLNSAQTLKIRH